MKKQSLNGKWVFCQQNNSNWLPATVPGSVHLDLLEAGLIPDPFYGANEDAVQWVISKNWDYQLTFTPDPEILLQEQVLLRFEGIDTIAEISLNGHRLGNTENMFRTYEYNVKDFINHSDNTLLVKFASLTETIERIHAEKQIPDTSPMGIEGGQYLRKAPCQFGWDWGPALPPIGIWKDVTLIGVSHPRINDVYLRQHHSDDVSISALITLDSDPIDSMKIEMCITTPDSIQIVSTGPATAQNSIITLIENPQLWFPNGYGDQPLYQIAILLKNGETILDRKEYQFGLRTIELLQRPDEWGKSFTFVVNGIPIFAKGSNWIPADSFPTRLTRSRMEQWIRDAAAANHNMLRVWGGGFYESEDFYDLCDQYGILVWQDFLFACKIYPFTDKAYIENVHQEVIENVRRLRHRASLALWCGNNEMEWGWEVWRWDKPENAHLKSAYDIFFHHLLPEWLEELDPDTQYWPSSPSSDLPFTDVNGQSAGDAHYWDVWHGGKPFTSYRKQFPRFMSEFGFQAFPTLETIQQYADKEDQNLTSYVMELHQKNNAGNRLIINQMTEWYKIPTTFDKLMYASHILQAEGIRYGVEHWRRFNSRVSGILYWQLNDCWPVASWASVDYFGRWKALHYAAKKFYAPILMSIFDEGQHLGVWLTNETLNDFSGEIRWQLVSTTGDHRQSGNEAVSIFAQSSQEIFTVDVELAQPDKYNTVFIAELWRQGQRISTQTVTFAPDKHVTYVDPELSATVLLKDHTAEICLTAKNLARFVEVKLKDIDTIFSDNYFDIPAGSSRTVTCVVPEEISLAELKERLSLMHLYESYQA
jgi:beta-mannosidase